MDDHDSWRLPTAGRLGKQALDLAAALWRIVRNVVGTLQACVARLYRLGVDIVWHHRAHERRDCDPSNGIHGEFLDKGPTVELVMTIVIVKVKGFLGDVFLA